MTLGQGALGKVKCASHVLMQTIVAVKKSPNWEHPHQIKNWTCKYSRSPQYYCTLLRKIIYIILEHRICWELLGRVVEFSNLQEKEYHRLFKQMTYALQYCHQKRNAHRDLKPKNILVDSKGVKRACVRPYEEEALSDHYKLLKSLGQGAFREVKLSSHFHTQIMVAVKNYIKSKKCSLNHEFK